MSNQFLKLDTLYPTLPNRSFGEVVSVAVNVYYAECVKTRGSVSGHTHFEGPDLLGVISWKRKAVYVNASVNAFHLHRGLCLELRHLPGTERFSTVEMSRAKHALALVVLRAYMDNSSTNHQYYHCSLIFTALGVVFAQQGVHDLNCDNGNAWL